MARRFRGAIPAMARICRRPWNGAAPRRGPAASCSSATIRMRRQAPGTIGRPTTFRLTGPDWPRARPGTHRRKDLKQAINDFRKPGYGGPCPPRRHGIHHYHFRLLALSVDQLPLRDKPSCRQVEREARKHVIAEATLVGLRDASPMQPASPRARVCRSEDCAGDRNSTRAALPQLSNNCRSGWSRQPIFISRLCRRGTRLRYPMRSKSSAASPAGLALFC